VVPTSIQSLDLHSLELLLLSLVECVKGLVNDLLLLLLLLEFGRHRQSWIARDIVVELVWLGRLRE